jgi:hypothetical protein
MRTAAAACCVAVVFAAPTTSARPADPELSAATARVYDVDVTVTLDTKVVPPGCEASGCDGYVGTAATTLRFEDVRVAFRKQRGTYSYLEITAEKRGTVRQAFDQRSRFCEQEKHVLRGDRAELRITGRLDLRREVKHERPPAGPFTMEIPSNGELTITTGGGGVDDYPQMCAPPRHVRVPVAERVETSLVGGSLLGNGDVTDFSFLVGRTRAGSPRFPLDALQAGEGFAVALKGSARDPSYPQVTTGAVRVVFTPARRAGRHAQPSSQASTSARQPMQTRTSAQGTATGNSSCTVVPTGWYWESGRKACFVVRTGGVWTHRASWTKDFERRPCAGSESTTLRWSASSTPFWVVAPRYPNVAPGDGRSATNFQFRDLRGEVTRHVTGGAYGFGCVPLLSRDCGRRTVEFKDAAAAYDSVYLESGERTLYLRYLTRTPSLAPYQACGLVPGRPPVFVNPPFPHAFRLSSARGPGSSGYSGWQKLFELVERRLLAVRVGGTVVFRGAGAPERSGTQEYSESGSWAGKLVFKRVS